jgi:hypothetical protein
VNGQWPFRMLLGLLPVGDLWIACNTMIIACFSCLIVYEPYHGKTNIVCLRPVWNQTRLTSMQSDQDPSWLLINHITSSETDSYITSSETDSEQHGSSSDCADAQVCLDPCWSQTHCLGFVVIRLILLSISYYKYMNI